MTCTNCGNNIPPNLHFCTNCGEEVLKDQPKERVFLKNLKLFPIKIFRFLFTKKVLVVMLIFVVLIFLFYWFAYLPKIEERKDRETKSACHYSAEEKHLGREYYEYNYKKCLRSNGLE